MCEICDEFSKVQVDWGNKLKSDAIRVDTTKETVNYISSLKASKFLLNKIPSLKRN
jgi:hypothetical protein